MIVPRTRVFGRFTAATGGDRYLINGLIGAPAGLAAERPTEVIP